MSQLVLNMFLKQRLQFSFSLKVVHLLKYFKPCSQLSLEFIKSVAMVQEYWSGVLEAAFQKEESCPVCYSNSKSV